MPRSGTNDAFSPVNRYCTDSDWFTEHNPVTRKTAANFPQIPRAFLTNAQSIAAILRAVT